MKQQITKPENLIFPDSGPINDPEMGMYDPSALSALERCPFLYYNLVEKGLKPSTPDSAALIFGEILHKGLAAIGKGQNLNEALALMREHPLILKASDSIRSPEKLEVVLRSYMENYVDDRFHPIMDDEERVVETAFAVNIDEYLLSGRIDKIVQENGRPEVYVLDHKTTSSIARDCQNLRPRLQFDLYALACVKLFGRCDGIIVDFIEITKAHCSSKNFQRFVTPRSEWELEQIEIQFLNHVKEIEWRREHNCWVTHRDSCFDYFRPCALQKLCTFNSDLGLQKGESDDAG